MSVITVLLALLAMLLLYFGIHLVINRGKIKLEYLLISILYSFAVGIPVDAVVGM